MGLFIPPNKLENLKLYKYSAEDHSLISRYVLKRWWNYFTQVFPMWMAPNVVTLLGLVFIVVNLLCVFYYNPYLDQAVPRWCYFFYAFGLFMYQTFDGCDGCHARRTGQSGPLGELFDHSVDAINTTFATVIFASVFRMGYGVMLLVAQFGCLCNFYASTWEEYHTKTLFLSQCSGPVEGIVIVIFLYALTGVFGPGIWSARLFDLDAQFFGIQIFDKFEVNVTKIYVALGTVGLIFNIYGAQCNVSKKYRSIYPSNPAKAYVESKTAFKGLGPFFAYYGSVFLLVYMYPAFLFENGFALIFSIGCTIAFSVGRIILAHLTLQDFPMSQYPMFCPLIQLIAAKIAITIFKFDSMQVVETLSWLGFGVTLGIHGMFVTEIIIEITSFLDIYALSIKHKRA